MKKHIEGLIEKFLKNEISFEESRELSKWIQNPENREFLKNEIRLYHLINEAQHDFNGKEAYNKIVFALSRKKSNKRSFISLKMFRYAALFVGLIGLGYSLYLFSQGNNVEELIIADEKITLQLGDGSIKTIELGKEKEIRSKKGDIVSAQKGDTLNYGEYSGNKTTVAYNTLMVPYGKTFNLKLSDGTIVHVNAGSTLRYPEYFIGDARTVFLKGEAFFDVAKNEKSPFTVHTETMDVEVLGTQFNVSAYEDDKEVSAVLVEGKVTLNSEHLDSVIALEPGQMGMWDNSGKRLTVEETNVYNHIAWMEGKVVFHKKTFKDILKVLERKYNVQIENQYKDLNDQRYQAIFDNETIEQVMRTFTESRLFNYTIKDNTILIEKPKEDN
ncbi:FecR family protein [Flagellimonas onchidii]|uniref:FecR family protein n=1 Tax=Flagellimonas onchidii TaxID=2562684 RepID=UPI0010A64453|nr:FecR family protein [Allomuricauda onchidii]